MPRGPLLAVFAPAGVVTVHRDIMDEFLKFKHLCTLRVVWPKQWWTRTVIKEMENIGKTWSEAEKIAKNRVQWRAIVKALCLRRAKETHNCAPVKVSTTWSEWRIKSLPRFPTQKRFGVLKVSGSQIYSSSSPRRKKAAKKFGQIIRKLNKPECSLLWLTMQRKFPTKKPCLLSSAMTTLQWIVERSLLTVFALVERKQHQFPKFILLLYKFFLVETNHTNCWIHPWRGSSQVCQVFFEYERTR